MRKRIEARDFKRLTWISVALAITAVTATVLTIFGLRHDAIEQALREQDNLAIVLGQQVSYSTRAIENTLDEVTDLIARLDPRDPADLRAKLETPEIQQLLKTKYQSAVKADAISIADDKGDFIVTTRNWPTPAINIADREHFKYFLDHSDNGIHIGETVVSRVSNETTLFFTKRVTARDGRLLGVALLGMNMRYYQSAYGAIASLKDKSILLLRNDGMVLVRYPDADSRAGARMPAGSPWYDLRARGGDYTSPGYFDSETRRVVVRPLDDYPLVINVAASESAILALWRARAAQIALGAVASLVCAGYLLRTARAQFNNLLASEASLEIKGAAIEELNARFNIMLDNMPHGVALFGPDKTVISANRRYGQMYGLSSTDVKPGTPLIDILDKRVRNGIFVSNADHYVSSRLSDVAVVEEKQTVERMSDGRVIFISRRPIPGGGWLTVHEDITARQHAEDQIKHMALHDQLTGTANRTLLQERIQLSFARVGRQNERFAILLLDLDEFKSVNDTHGHPVGDGLLRAVARRLRESVRELDLVARIGGDEFAIVQSNIGEGADGANALARRILGRIREPFEIDGVVISTFPSIGVAIAPDNGLDADGLMQNADIALYRAKTEGRNCIRFYDPRMDMELRLQRALKADLAEAINDRRIEVFYQPIMDAGSLTVVGMEALARWRHPSHGLIPPDRFIGLAEQSGLINQLGALVLRTACVDAMQWPGHVGLSVNLSAMQFREPTFVEGILEILATSGLPPHRLTLEITESVLMEDLDIRLAALDALKRAGVRFALDDFGKGYSSLSYLQNFPLDSIKIDRSFIDAMATQQRTREIVALIVAMAKCLGIPTTAEGIETREQLELARVAGCDTLQGYYFSQPRRIEEFDFAALAKSPPQLAA